MAFRLEGPSSDNVAVADPARLRRIKVRFSKAGLPGGPPHDPGLGGVDGRGVIKTYGFETAEAVAARQSCCRNGIAEVVDARR